MRNDLTTTKPGDLFFASDLSQTPHWALKDAGGLEYLGFLDPEIKSSLLILIRNENRTIESESVMFGYIFFVVACSSLIFVSCYTLENDLTVEKIEI